MIDLERHFWEQMAHERVASIPTGKLCDLLCWLDKLYEARIIADALVNGSLAIPAHMKRATNLIQCRDAVCFLADRLRCRMYPNFVIVTARELKKHRIAFTDSAYQSTDIWASQCQEPNPTALGLIADAEEEAGGFDQWINFLRWCWDMKRWPSSARWDSHYRWHFITMAEKRRSSTREGCYRIRPPFEWHSASEKRRHTGWTRPMRTVKDAFTWLFILWCRQPEEARAACFAKLNDQEIIA
jgi:hypothetical protein